MIPIRLTLRNFMCYRDNVPSISFESLHTACISGNNGNGKSALIDAITWALWGQTRAGSDDELIHTGQNDAQVEFDFALGQQQYRIIRKRSKPKTQKSSGQTILELQAFTPEGYKSLTGDNVIHTQQKIVQLLHMDYDTFINSAFLRQGRADEFTKKRPGERKQVLGNILQLSVYDELEEQSKDLAKGLENVINQFQSTLAGMQEELAHKADYQTEYDSLKIEIDRVDKTTKDHEMKLAALRQDKQALEAKKVQLDGQMANIKDTESNYKLWQEQVLQCRSRIKNYEDLISQRAKIEENFNRLTEARKQFQELNQKLQKVTALMQNKHQLEITIFKAAEQLKETCAVAKNRLQELDEIASKLPQLQEQLKLITDQLTKLKELDTKLQEQRENSKLIRARVHHLQAERTRYIQDIQQIDEKLKILTHAEGVTCPLCETELGAEGEKRIEAKYKTEKTTKNDVLKSIQVELAQKEAEAREIETTTLNDEAKLKRSLEVVQNKYGTLTKAITDAQTAEEKIKTGKTFLADIEAKLAKKEYANEQQSLLIQVENEINNIGYNSEVHEHLRTELATLEQYEDPKRKLEEADRQIVQARESEVKACQTSSELLSRIEKALQQRDALTADINVASQVDTALNLADQQYQKLLSDQKHLQEVLGGARARLERLADLETKSKEKENQLAQAARQDKIYKDLAQAFGKKGIQAMLIEMAIPEIEAEANKLLMRMTDNRMSVKLETQRATKKGDVQETLDINISDELGTRNYEMFSGGEAFRIDFAIRIALSKLLARRAGAPLPTLIVDEGFGTQDSNGIEKIKEAITSIQDDFEKILVITHISDLKDAFPVRIEVVKTPEGSTLYLN